MVLDAKIKEIFLSVQGEGPYIGYKQLFIRFAGCNLMCSYCDTNHETDTVDYSSNELLKKINKLDLNNIHSISLTGGEPLLYSDFLNEFLPLCEQKIYLETNGTLPDELEKIVKHIDYASVDIKLDSIANQGNLFILHEKFFKILKNSNVRTFAKIVFDSNIKKSEIKCCSEICRNYDIELILQPVTINNALSMNGEILQQIQESFLNFYKNTRLIPQVHKFMNIE